MSVIENAIKRLQASRAGAAAEAGSAGAAARPPSATGSESHPAVAPPQEPVRRPAREPKPGQQVVDINIESLRVQGLLPPVHQEREIAQQYRQIKRPLIRNARGEGSRREAGANLIMVASAVPGEGKTFTTLNLALSLQLEQDFSVLLIDGDVVNPRLSEILGATGAPGLLDVLQNSQRAVEDLILPTTFPNISFLPAGHPEENTTELLSSARMEDVVRDLAAHDTQRLIVFDSAPLLLTTESHALAHLVGQIVVVVRADDTPQHVLLEALEGLGEDQSVSLVLNQSTRKPHEGYYGPYGAYGGSSGVYTKKRGQSQA